MIRNVEELLRTLTTGVDRRLFIFNLESLDIFKQLRFEEFIYRNVTPKCNNTAFLILNHIYKSSTVVFGLSGDVKDFIKDINYCKSNNIQLIRRFTGGGTVLIDDNIITSSIIATHSFAPNLNPNNISQWAFKFYQATNLFNNQFSVIDGDFSYHNTNTINTINTINSSNNTINNTINPINSSNTNSNTVNTDNLVVTVAPMTFCKVGGNAQAYSKYSFVHHTSFIWQVSPMIEKILLVPKKAPKYRNNRGHTQFLKSVTNTLRNINHKDQFIQMLIESLTNLYPTTLIRVNGVDGLSGGLARVTCRLDNTIENTIENSIENSMKNGMGNGVKYIKEEVINNCINNFKSHTNYIHFYSLHILHILILFTHFFTSYTLSYLHTKDVLHIFIVLLSVTILLSITVLKITKALE